MGGRISAARVKAHHTYTVEEAAEAVNATPQTIRAWTRRGLHVLNETRPFLILGCALKAFVEDFKAKRKRPLKIGQFYCMRCKDPRGAAFGMASYHRKDTSGGAMVAFCEECEGPVRVNVKKADLPTWGEIYEIDGSDGRDP